MYIKNTRFLKKILKLEDLLFTCKSNKPLSLSPKQVQIYTFILQEYF